jgi:transposase
LPKELGCGSGTTCWRRLRDWQKARVWERLHETLLNWLGDEAAIDWSRASVDSLSIRVKRGGQQTGRNPVDRGKPGSKYHLRSLRARGITSRIARRGIDSSERLGQHRWVVERSLSWLLGFRRLSMRYERRADLLQGLLHLACVLICCRFLTPSPG